MSDIKSSIGEIEAKFGELISRVDNLEERAVALEERRGLSETEELDRVRDHLKNVDNSGRRCNIKIMGLSEYKDGIDIIKFLQHKLPVMLGTSFRAPQCASWRYSAYIEWVHLVAPRERGRPWPMRQRKPFSVLPGRKVRSFGRDYHVFSRLLEGNNGMLHIF